MEQELGYKCISCISEEQRMDTVLGVLCKDNGRGGGRGGGGTVV